MKNFISLTVAAVAALATPSIAIAQQADGGTPAVTSSATRLPAGTLARYRVTYMNSQAPTTGIRSSTIVSITNNSFNTCTTGVDWRVGFGGLACTTTLVLGPGQTGEHCSRNVPGTISVCNAICPGASGLFAEGNAVVGSTVAPPCDRIQVSARTVYTTGTDDGNLTAITDAKVVKMPLGNIGD